MNHIVVRLQQGGSMWSTNKKGTPIGAQRLKSISSNYLLSKKLKIIVTDETRLKIKTKYQQYSLIRLYESSRYYSEEL